MSTRPYRLPAYALPKQYDLRLDARLGREAFFGQVTIQVDIVEAQEVLELHARNLTISRAQLAAGAQTLAGAVELDPERERAILKFEAPLPTGSATLTLDFEGKVSQGLQGLYLAQDKPEQLLCTQCEATDARAIFPCWDEPAFKARFSYQITTAPEAVVLANTPLLSATEADGSTTRTFAPTRVMSTYLVAFVIGDVASTPEETVNGTPLRVWAMRGKEALGDFALRYTARLLPWYEDYFGAPYHFDKYDQVAVPGFSAGAMENSGLVLFRQNLLLMSPGGVSWGQEKSIAHVIAHEFAHMWFGNYVTMQWWDDLWLNEAFAEWISHKAVNELSPDYRIWDDFQSGKNGALAKDALESTHPIYSPVETPEQASELFDAITYTKGCAVLRMLENFLGAEAFRAGLRTYMREFAERNARGADLWRHLQAASHRPVTQIMESWILQSGYPCVAVAHEGGHQLRLRQQRFFSSPAAPADHSQLWQVPLVLRYADDAGAHETRYVLTGREAVLPLDVTGALSWCYANADEVGFYRQNLQGPLLKEALAHLSQLTPSEQMGLLGDQWALTRNGAQTITQFLDVLDAFAQSQHYNVLFEVVGRLHALERLVEEAGDETALQRFRGWVDRLFAARLDQLGFAPREGETTETSQTRISVVDAMTTLAHDLRALAEAGEWAAQEAADPKSVDPNLASTLVAAAAQFGDLARFQEYVRIYQRRKAAAFTPQEVQRYLYSFPAFRAPELVAQTLSLMDEDVIPKESIGPVLTTMLTRRHSQVPAWEYLKANWAKLSDLGMAWTHYLIETAGQLPVSYRADFMAFYDSRLNGAAQMSYARALETMDQLAEFKIRIHGDLLAWLKR